MSLLLLAFTFLLCRSPCDASVEKERTLAMIKPDGVFGNYTDKIKEVILESGFSIITEMVVQLDEGNATVFYVEHSHRDFFPGLVKYMTSGPVYIMVLEKVNAISDWRALIGPTDARKARISHPSSIRAMCGLDSEMNCVHGSDSPQSAAREISFFFGEMPGGIVRHEEL
ncbi:Nucleoside diphosphate kinase 1 [Acorus calamus]|uniref:Nucleoside diphosphate kinase n=1 Tax=Acorus calamus TaxID=4465 RepID=A0AAV9E4R2_ACOCL|nr:Nucleoside diphosphate kinase 1 [Acorus calamus]